jgi:GNAT superfamily N-acetyltransferase
LPPASETSPDAGDVQVRRVHPDGWRELRDIRLRALTDSPDAFASTLDRELAFAETDWQWRIANGCNVVAAVDGEPVGLAGGYLHDGVPELIAMWVQPESRGTGAAERLVEAIADWAREQDADRLTLWVVDGNEWAERFYRRLGFARTGAAQPVPGNPRLTEVEMARPLG